MRDKIVQLEPPILDGDKFNKLICIIDNKFYHAIKRTYSSFCELGRCLTAKKDRNSVIYECNHPMMILKKNDEDW